MKRNAESKDIMILDGNMTADELQKAIPRDFLGKVELHGNLVSNHSIAINNSLLVTGDISFNEFVCCEDENIFDISVTGSLECGGDLRAKNVTTTNTFCTNGEVVCWEICTGNDFICESAVTAMYAVVKGNFFCKKNVDISKICVTGDFKCGGYLFNTRYLKVQGQAEYKL